MFTEFKKCSKCGKEQPLEYFTKDKTRKDGLFPYCKGCKSELKRKYYQENKEKVLAKAKEWVKNNRKRRNEIQKNYRIRNREKIAEQVRRRKNENPEWFKLKQRKYYTKNKEIILKKLRDYYKKFPERRKEAYRKHYIKNREKILSRQREWYANNANIHAERVKSWGKRNKEKALAIIHKRRALKLKNGGSYTAEEWEKLKRKYNYKCLCCGKKEPEIKLTVDHVIPLVKGGKNDITNIQPLCRYCNQSKNTKIIDYREVYLSESNQGT